MHATAILLAAGLGTRMKSRLPKAMHPLAGRPMLRHLIESCEAVFDRIVVVVGPGMEALAAIAAPHEVVVQEERLGTAHAALQASGLFGEGDVAVLYADNPLISPATLRRLIEARRSQDTGLALLAMRPADPQRYGRVIARDGRIERIVEWADASADERAVGLCNAGVLCAAADDFAAWLNAVDNRNARGEFYLTDVVTLATSRGATVRAVEAPEAELRGINSREELAAAEAEIQHRLRLGAMEGGATLIAPETVFLCADTVLQADVVVHPHVVFGAGVHVGAGSEIRAFSHLEGCVVGEGTSIGPYARLRPGTRVGDGAHVGNFVELKATDLGPGAKAGHLSYLGDASIGAGTNVGAGTITCNYDGVSKHRTVVGEDVFLGSNAILVAPVTLGDRVLVAAGSVITESVEADAMAVGRARQTNKPGYARSWRARLRARAGLGKGKD